MHATQTRSIQLCRRAPGRPSGVRLVAVGLAVTSWMMLAASSLLAAEVPGGAMLIYDATTEEAASPAVWRLVTDQVMGGVSQGATALAERAGRTCRELRGEVSTENNGGFVQIAVDLGAPAAGKTLDASAYAGFEIDVFGSADLYNLHLRTTDTRLPWQAYRVSFEAQPRWQRLRFAFSDFAPYRIQQPLRTDRLRRLGLVAIGRPFTADVCVARIALFTAPPAEASSSP